MEKLKGARVIVTGGTGFIGGHLVESLLHLGADIIVPFIELPPKSYFSKNNLRKDVLMVETDLRDREKLFRLIKITRPDFIVHLGAVTIVEEAFSDPLRTLETNITGTVNILEAVRRFGVGKSVIIASSDKAYGKSDKPYKEGTALKGDHPYDVSKSAADLITQMYNISYSLPSVVTRSCNVYGEGDLHLDRIIPGICEALSEDKVLKIRSNGKYVRDFMYVKDLTDGYLFLMSNYKKTLGEAYNFSAGQTLSVTDLVKNTETVLGKKVRYEIINSAKNEIPYQKINSRKIQKLGWKSKYTFDNTIGAIYNWYDLNKPWNK